MTSSITEIINDSAATKDGSTFPLVLYSMMHLSVLSSRTGDVESDPLTSRQFGQRLSDARIDANDMYERIKKLIDWISRMQSQKEVDAIDKLHKYTLVVASLQLVNLLDLSFLAILNGREHVLLDTSVSEGSMNTNTTVLTSKISIRGGAEQNIQWEKDQTVFKWIVNYYLSDDVSKNFKSRNSNVFNELLTERSKLRNGITDHVPYRTTEEPP